MKPIRTCLTVAMLSLATGTAVAADLQVKTPWVRGTVAGQKATGAFMELASPAGVAIVGATSPVAGITEIHEMTMDGGVMKMRAIPRLEIVAGKPVNLAPGGYHVMLMDLKQPLKAGEQVPITLVFEDAAQKRFTQEIKAPVTALGGGNAPMPMNHGAHKH